MKLLEWKLLFLLGKTKKINLPFKSQPRKEFGFGLNSQGETGGG